MADGVAPEDVYDVLASGEGIERALNAFLAVEHLLDILGCHAVSHQRGLQRTVILAAI